MANYIKDDNNNQRIVQKNNKSKSILLSTSDIVVIVVEVEKNSPAAIAGFQPNDIILEVNGNTTNGMRSIYDAIGLQVGRKISFLVKRNNKYDPIVINVTTESERA